MLDLHRVGPPNTKGNVQSQKSSKQMVSLSDPLAPIQISKARGYFSSYSNW